MYLIVEMICRLVIICYQSLVYLHWNVWLIRNTMPHTDNSLIGNPIFNVLLRTLHTVHVH